MECLIQLDIGMHTEHTTYEDPRDQQNSCIPTGIIQSSQGYSHNEWSKIWDQKKYYSSLKSTNSTVKIDAESGSFISFGPC